MADFSAFSAFIKSLIEKDSFKQMASGDVLGPIKDQSQKQAVIEAALMCIFVSPQGVRRMTATKDFDHIKNKKNWQPFCTKLLKYVQVEFKESVKVLEEVSGLFSSYGKFWPDCDTELSKDVEKALAASKK
jgi:hypothetical protein